VHKFNIEYQKCTHRYSLLKSNENFKNERGYALPSVLFLITILSIVILSILALQYFQRQNIQTAAAKVKADYSAQSGISKIFSEIKSNFDLPPIGRTIERSYDLGDGEKASVSMEWWGFYLYVRSIGSFRKINETRFALAGQTPAGRFKNSLVFSNRDHQLVLTGYAHIKGDVIVGPSGVTLGTLSKYPTPRVVPIEGKVKRDPNINIQDFDIVKHYDNYDALLNGAIPVGVGQSEIQNFQSGSQLHITNGTIKPETKYVSVKGNASINCELIRHDNPLYIIFDGEVTFGKDVHIDGIIFIASSQRIKINSTAHIDEAVLYSHKEVIVESNANLIAQIIAPSIQIEQGVKMLYPSALVSYIKKNNKEPQNGIIIRNNGQVEGNVIVYSEDNTNSSVFLNIEPSAKISGFVVCNASITFEGSVDGCVQTKDFYFYESPTTYFGWIRTGRIDRDALPGSALMTIGIDGVSKLQVLDWL
jgi:hypothetical protein